MGVLNTNRAASSSSPSERLFSLTGYQVWDRRNKISSERVEYRRITVVRSWNATQSLWRKE
ncbi:hypothetical protein BpHYR1_032683 [Brachionus plicatilis]|uniref:HAT C-terminal dimerisation domain-containing protein n=1 Tax=Brachionus plicatilis TaxID=10195 RepID=A0A3M7QR00_BRAPC|nr:hypothetical protein BpHYR1_032683 [Brachionus plicatilis]